MKNFKRFIMHPTDHSQLRTFVATDTYLLIFVENSGFWTKFVPNPADLRCV